MSRALWSGTVSFGLVEIPVSLHTAENAAHELHFHLLDRRSMKPVGYQRVNKESGEDVPWDEIVRGYQYEKGEYVVLTDEELHRANVEKSESIDILGFVDLADIEPVYFEKPYYLKPLKKGSKGYSLLLETLSRTGKAGIAKLVLRTREHVAALVPRGRALSLVLLRYADEVKTPESLDIGESSAKKEISDKELKLAEQLVEGMEMKWDPKQFHDTYREDVMDLIDRKIKAGKTREVLLEKEKPRKKPAEVHDLMPLLKKSLEQGARARPRAAAATKRRSPQRTRKGA